VESHSSQNRGVGFPAHFSNMYLGIDMANPITRLSPAEEQEQEQETAREGYLHRVLVAGDIFTNVLLGGNPDETISSRCARGALASKWWGIGMSWFLNLFETDHGAKAMAGDEERAKRVERLERT
jgi:hypothetical protein